MTIFEEASSAWERLDTGEVHPIKLLAGQSMNQQKTVETLRGIIKSPSTIDSFCVKYLGRQELEWLLYATMQGAADDRDICLIAIAIVAIACSPEFDFPGGQLESIDRPIRVVCGAMVKWDMRQVILEMLFLSENAQLYYKEDDGFPYNIMHDFFSYWTSCIILSSQTNCCSASWARQIIKRYASRLRHSASFSIYEDQWLASWDVFRGSGHK